MNPNRRSVLITGAAGRVGRLLTAAWRDRYQLSLTDLVDTSGLSSASFTRGDNACFDVIRPLCEGIDTVVHLAGRPQPRTTGAELRHNNLRTIWNTLRAARDARCRRVVFASSAMVDLDPALSYSHAKLVGERLSERYSGEGGPSVICLRLGRLTAPNALSVWPDAPYLPYLVFPLDAVDGFTRAVEAPRSVHFGVFTIVSANRVTHVDISNSRGRLGYAPTMDSFALADARYHSALGLLKRGTRWIRRHL